MTVRSSLRRNEEQKWSITSWSDRFEPYWRMLPYHVESYWRCRVLYDEASVWTGKATSFYRQNLGWQVGCCCLDLLSFRRQFRATRLYLYYRKLITWNGLLKSQRLTCCGMQKSNDKRKHESLSTSSRDKRWLQSFATRLGCGCNKQPPMMRKTKEDIGIYLRLFRKVTRKTCISKVYYTHTFLPVIKP